MQENKKNVHPTICMNLIFIGSIYPKKLLNELLAMNTYVDFAANRFQEALISGLDMHCDTVKVITSPVIRMSCRQKKYFKGYLFKHNEQKQNTDVYIGNITYPIINMLYEFIKIRKKLKIELKKNPETNVIIYALHSPFLMALASLSKKISRSCVIVPDLPEYMTDKKSLLYRIAKSIDKKMINFCLKKCDSFVLLSPYMKERLSIGRKPWIQIEGIYQTSVSLKDQKKEKNKTILYTGGIATRYGVFDMVEAFTRIRFDNYRLWLCGVCEEMDKLNHYLQNDNRISYLGQVDKNKINELQRRASLLVNPRHSEEEFTKYSFPSKTMEYLASGTPTVMCKLLAVPEEYFKHLFFFDDESIDGYAKKMVEICSMDSVMLQLKGKTAANFVIIEKNECIQSKKILDLMFYK